MKNYRTTSKKSSRPSLPRILIGLGGILLIAGVLAVLDARGVVDLPFFKDEAKSGTIPSTNTDTTRDTSGDKSTNATSDNIIRPNEGPKEGDASAQAPINSGAAPITPYGNFVSNHRPNLDGNPAPSSVQSVCNTTAGATCYIEFVNQDGVVKQLAAQKTDSGGATSWNWDVKQAGFTIGSWKITVYASLNGKTESASDVQNLEVGP